MLLFILSVKYGNGMPQSSISRPNVVNGIDASEPIPWQVCCLHRSMLIVVLDELHRLKAIFILL